MRKIAKVVTVLLFLGLFPNLSMSYGRADSIDVDCKPVASSPRTPPAIAQPLATSSAFPEAITLVTNCGEITISLNSKYAPVTSTALIALSSGSYYDNSSCNRITTSGLFVIQCGDPTLTGLNIPKGWSGYVDENLPISKENNYPAGTVAMVNSGPRTNGAQFFIVYKDTTIAPSYSVWGNVISGMSILNFVSAQGAQQGMRDGPLNQPLLIERVILRDKQWMEAFAAGRTESIRMYEDKLDDLAELPRQNETFKAQIEAYVKASNFQLSQIANLELQVNQLKEELAKISNQLVKSTITCTKGKATKKVTAVSPKCPAGYKKK